MNNTSKNKTLLFIIAFLLITNIAAVLYFVLGKEDRHRNERDRSKNGMMLALQKEVGFSDTQVAVYTRLKEAHWKTAKPMFEAMQKSKDSLFSLVKVAGTPDSIVKSLAAVTARRQQDIDIEAFYHFKAIRDICTQEQLPRYDSLIKKMMAKKNKPQGRSDDRNKTSDSNSK